MAHKQSDKKAVRKAGGREVEERLARLLQMPGNDVQEQKRLLDLGMDSMLVVEVRQTCALGCEVPIAELMMAEATVGSLVSRVAEDLDKHLRHLPLGIYVVSWKDLRRCVLQQINCNILYSCTSQCCLDVLCIAPFCSWRPSIYTIGKQIGIQGGSQLKCRDKREDVFSCSATSALFIVTKYSYYRPSI